MFCSVCSVLKCEQLICFSLLSFFFLEAAGLFTISLKHSCGYASIWIDFAYITKLITPLQNRILVHYGVYREADQRSLLACGPMFSFIWYKIALW